MKPKHPCQCLHYSSICANTLAWHSFTADDIWHINLRSWKYNCCSFSFQDIKYMPFYIQKNGITLQEFNVFPVQLVSTYTQHSCVRSPGEIHNFWSFWIINIQILAELNRLQGSFKNNRASGKKMSSPSVYTKILMNLFFILSRWKSKGF